MKNAILTIILLCFSFAFNRFMRELAKKVKQSEWEYQTLYKTTAIKKISDTCRKTLPFSTPWRSRWKTNPIAGDLTINEADLCHEKTHVYYGTYTERHGINNEYCYGTFKFIDNYPQKGYAIFMQWPNTPVRYIYCIPEPTSLKMKME